MNEGLLVGTLVPKTLPVPKPLLVPVKAIKSRPKEGESAKNI
ncbi:MAG: hypothetical protein ACYTX0_30200 [Nostoc sp.]